MIENTILKRNRAGRKARVFSLTFPSRELVELGSRAASLAAGPAASRRRSRRTGAVRCAWSSASDRFVWTDR